MRGRGCVKNGGMRQTSLPYVHVWLHEWYESTSCRTIETNDVPHCVQWIKKTKLKKTIVTFRSLEEFCETKSKSNYSIWLFTFYPSSHILFEAHDNPVEWYEINDYSYWDSEKLNKLSKVTQYKESSLIWVSKSKYSMHCTLITKI